MEREDTMHIPDGELFADLQATMTDIVLIEMLGYDYSGEYNTRLESSRVTRDTIVKIMQLRFSPDDIKRFLESGYPRATNLNNVIL